MIEKLEMNMKLIDVYNKPNGYLYRANNRCKIDELVGKAVRGLAYSDEYFQILTDDCIYIFYHEYNCCESVWLTQVDGISDKIIGSRIVIAEVVTKTGEDVAIDTDNYDSVTYSFYKIGTSKGMIDFRFQGVSNGYYSETVDLVKVEV